MLISEHVQHIKNVLSGGNSSDDFKIPDRQIYFVLRYLRARLIKTQVDRYNYINDYNYQNVDCLPLELVKVTNCNDCVQIDNECYVLQSKCDLPKIMSNRNQLLVDSVRTVLPESDDPFLKGKEISKLTRYSKFRKTGNGLYYEIHNKKLRVYGTTTLQAVSLRALFEDPLELANLNCCDDGASSCFNPNTEDFPIEAALADTLHKMTYEELAKIMMNIPEDMENDAKDERN
jgi:hypothetical protein